MTILYDVLKSDLSNGQKRYLVHQFDTVLSLNLLDEDASVIDNDLEEYIKDAITRRNEAKKNKDYALADQIRTELLEKGVTLIDTREGTKYEVN